MSARQTPGQGGGREGGPAAPVRPVELDQGTRQLVEVAPPAKSRLSRSERRFLWDAHRPLDAWERYRALSDVLEEAIGLVELADKKARFALMVMGAVNALLFMLAAKTNVFDAVPASWRPAVLLVIGLYGLVAVYFVMQAIESLRPRRAQPHVQHGQDASLKDFPVALRFYEDILTRDVEAYRTSWRKLRIGQLNAELAVQAHALATINKAKYTALRRLYFGLQLMTVLAALVMAAGAYLLISR